MTLQQLLSLHAVIQQGGFQSGAKALHKTHPSVLSAIRKLEEEVGFSLFDRHAYRATLTEEGHSFYQKSKKVLVALEGLKAHAAQLVAKEETALNVVIGDLTPIDTALSLLRQFFFDFPHTQLNLHFEAIGGPTEKLLDGEVDLIIHFVDGADPRIEYQDFCTINLLPVAAPDFLGFEINDRVTYTQLRDHPQCIIRDSAKRLEKRNYYVIEGARSLTVADQYTKKEVILQGMGWGYMPAFMVQRELKEKRLVSMAGRHLKRQQVEIKTARLSDAPRGPVASRLWDYLASSFLTD